MRLFATTLILLLNASLIGQTELGLRFSTNFNYFPNPELNGFPEDYFSTGILGVYGVHYTQNSRLELGVNLLHKGTGNGRFPNLPLVMQDFDDAQNVGLTAVEMHFRAGPNIKNIFHPKIGYVIGVRLRSAGFQNADSIDINDAYLTLPFGFSVDLPTQFGSVGFGLSYYLGITNVLKNPGPGNGSGRMRAFNFELTVAYAARRKIFPQKRK